MNFFFFFFLTQLLLEAAVRLRVPDGGADKDLRGGTAEDLGEQRHQTGRNVRVIHHICSTET